LYKFVPDIFMLALYPPDRNRSGDQCILYYRVGWVEDYSYGKGCRSFDAWERNICI